MVRQFRQFAPSKKRVSFPADLFRLAHDEVLRHLIGTEDERKNLDRRFKLFRHHIISAELMELFQFTQIPSSDDDVNLRVQSASDLHGSARHEGVRDGHDQDSSLFDFDVSQYGRICCVPVVER